MELSETANFVYTLHKQATLKAHLTNFSFEFFYAIFTEDASILFYAIVQKSQKWPKSQIMGCPALRSVWKTAVFRNFLEWTVRMEED